MAELGQQERALSTQVSECCVVSCIRGGAGCWQRRECEGGRSAAGRNVLRDKHVMLLSHTYAHTHAHTHTHTQEPGLWLTGAAAVHAGE